MSGSYEEGVANLHLSVMKMKANQEAALRELVRSEVRSCQAKLDRDRAEEREREIRSLVREEITAVEKEMRASTLRDSSDALRAVLSEHRMDLESMVSKVVVRMMESLNLPAPSRPGQVEYTAVRAEVAAALETVADKVTDRLLSRSLMEAVRSLRGYR